METCQSILPAPMRLRCGKPPHAERYACQVSGTDEFGVHWTLTWWKPGADSGDRRADGLPMDATAGSVFGRSGAGGGRVPALRLT